MLFFLEENISSLLFDRIKCNFFTSSSIAFTSQVFSNNYISLKSQNKTTIKCNCHIVEDMIGVISKNSNRAPSWLRIQVKAWKLIQRSPWGCHNKTEGSVHLWHPKDVIYETIYIVIKDVKNNRCKIQAKRAVMYPLPN